MISLKKGNPVAVIYTGKDEGKKIFITNDSGDTELKQDPLELFGNHELAPSKKLMSAAQRRAIRTALLDDRRDYPSELEDHMESLRELYDRKNRYEYRTDSETLCVYPSKDSERIFVAGKSGSGKSTFTAQYIREYTEMFPKRNVFLISTHEDEKAATSRRDGKAVRETDRRLVRCVTKRNNGGTFPFCSPIPAGRMEKQNEHQIGGDHYVTKSVQPWDAMKAWMSHEEFAGFLRGNVIKYIARYKDKGGLDDLQKARHYLDKFVNSCRI